MSLKATITILVSWQQHIIPTYLCHQFGFIMNKMSEVFKELYPPVNKIVENAMQELCIFPNINFSLGNIHEIQISPLHKECVKVALQKLDNICQDCTGNHQYWTVAGGFATYHLGYTNQFSDIDIFVSCNGRQNQAGPSEKFHTCSDDWSWYRDRNVCTFFYKGIKTQIIQVNFNSTLKDHSVRAFYDFLHVYVISSFDIPLCKVSMRFDLGQSNITYAVDLTSVETNKATTVFRKTKYANTKVEGILKQVPKLSLLAAQALFIEQ